MKQISKEEFEKLPSYPYIEPAISLPFNPQCKCAPFTKDGYLSVAAIYNMSAWASWKSSSLGTSERVVAESIGDIPLYKLMQMNAGRRINQPALFPEGNELPPCPLEERLD